MRPINGIICSKKKPIKKKCRYFELVFDYKDDFIEIVNILYVISMRYKGTIYGRIKFLSNIDELQSELEKKLLEKINFDELNVYNHKNLVSPIKDYIKSNINFKELSPYFSCYLLLLAIDNIIFGTFKNYIENIKYNSKYVKINNKNFTKKVFLKPPEKLIQYFSEKKFDIVNHADNDEIIYKLNNFCFPSIPFDYEIDYHLLSYNIIKDNQFEIVVSTLCVNDLKLDVEKVNEELFTVNYNYYNNSYYENVCNKIEEIFSNENLNMIIFPELSISSEILNILNNKVNDNCNSNLIMISGSFHEKMDKENIKNSIHISNSMDNQSINQWKVNPFENKDMTYKKTRDKGYENPEYYEIFDNQLKEGATENISYSPKKINIIDTKDFRLAVILCNDFLKDEIISILKEYCVNLVIVCSWTGSLDKFEGNCKNLSNFNNAVSIICNHCLKNPDKEFSRIYYPIPHMTKKFKCNGFCKDNSPESYKMNYNKFDLLKIDK
jgi:hypothetical protein